MVSKFKLKMKEEGIAYSERHPARHFFEKTGKTIFRISTFPLMAGMVGTVAYLGTSVEPPIALGVIQVLGGVGVFGGAILGVTSETSEEGRKHYFFRFYPNKYDKKGVIIVAKDRGEASGIYLTRLLHNRGYKDKEIRNMNQLEIIDALEKRKGK